jgi:hypothetical protein
VANFIHVFHKDVYFCGDGIDLRSGCSSKQFVAIKGPVLSIIEHFNPFHESVNTTDNSITVIPPSAPVCESKSLFTTVPSNQVLENLLVRKGLYWSSNAMSFCTKSLDEMTTRGLITGGVIRTKRAANVTVERCSLNVLTNKIVIASDTLESL